VTENTTNTITVNMNHATIVPKKIFESIKGQDVTVIFKVADGIEWSINGNDVTGADNSFNLNDVDMNVDLGADNIPEELISNLSASEDATVQLSLAYDGGFGFTATLRINLDKQNHGEIANLFYYNPNTKQLDLQSAMRIDETGNAQFDFVHASDYVIVMDNGETVQKLADQIVITPSKKVLYIGGNKDKSIILSVELPEILKTSIENESLKKTISYTSSNSKIATVSSNGKVTAKKPGIATITTVIVVNGVEKSIQTKITVKNACIKLVASVASMKQGDQSTFQAKGYGIDSSMITWSTSKKSIVIIDKKNGIATSKTTGTDYVIAKYKGIAVKSKVIVKK
ncbi:MAG: Ig-like domain-containing protein, partial [Mobilitalea sp.]